MKNPTTSPSESRAADPAGQLSANGSIDTATLDLLAGWRNEDATNDAEQIRDAERELAEFKRAMNDSRTRVGEPLLYP